MRADGRREPAWWTDAVGYEVYIRSFADGNGDGVGDLIGLRERLAHVAWLGADTVWVTPFYPSPMADFGYDVSDYCDVDPMFGTLVDFDALIDEARRQGLRVLVDLVPNHTSDQHPWFVDARHSRRSDHRNWYVWRDPAPGGAPPNNWVSHFGGPAWTFDEATGQYYLHLFLREQPDLNWSEPAVADAFDDILRFWLDRGVDGFRIDVAHALVQDASLRDNPVLAAVRADMTPRQAFACFEHLHDLDQPGVTDVFRRWRGVAEEYGAVLLGEVYLHQAPKVARYVEPASLHSAFWFAPMHMRWQPDVVRAVLVDGVSWGRGGFAWVQSSHDERRSVTRFGGGRVGQERALVLSTLYAGLPGMMFLYQGEELGLGDGVVRPDQLADPVGTRSTNPAGSRDGCRTPVPWEPVDGWGFTGAGVEPWLPFGDRTPEDCVSSQRDDPDSWLHRYRRLVAARHALPRTGADVEWLEQPEPVLAFRRGPLLVVANLGDEPATPAAVAGAWSIRYATHADAMPDHLPPRSAVMALQEP